MGRNTTYYGEKFPDEVAIEYHTIVKLHCGKREKSDDTSTVPLAKKTRLNLELLHPWLLCEWVSVYILVISCNVTLMHSEVRISTLTIIFCNSKLITFQLITVTVKCNPDKPDTKLINLFANSSLKKNNLVKMGIKQFHLGCTVIVWYLFSLWIKCFENSLGAVVILPLIRTGNL